MQGFHNFMTAEQRPLLAAGSQVFTFSSIGVHQIGGVLMKKGKVILADKHQGMLAGVRTLLESSFEKVFMVADEASLLEAAEKIMPDLIIADLSLPVTKEINIARRLRKIFPDIKLIILSVHDEPAAIRECMDAGVAGYVLKRTAVNDLIPAIEAIQQGDKYISRSSAARSPEP
jgi:DNA-binding NarL/FixJ family response regulator